MKTTFVTIAIAGVAAAQALDGIAPCVRSCIEKALQSVGCTGSPDQIALCGCTSQDKLAGPVTQCVTKNGCQFSDLLDAQAISVGRCAALATSHITASSSAPYTGSHTTTLAPGSSPVGSISHGISHSASSGAAIVTSHVKNATSSFLGSHPASGTVSLAPTGSHTGPQITSTAGAAVLVPAVGAVAALFAAAVAI